MLEAVTEALPLAEMAAVELESTNTLPETLVSAMLAFPERVRAPAAVGSRTSIDGLTVIVRVPALLWKLPSPP